MAIVYVCDFCGEEIPGGADWMQLSLKQSGDSPLAQPGSLGLYHKDPCWDALWEGVLLVESMGPTLARPTISNQRVAARRRKQTKPEGSE